VQVKPASKMEVSMTNKLLKSLFIKSAQIQSQIDEEAKFSRKDWIRIIRLKKIRLKIKDKILSVTSKTSKNRGYKQLQLNKQ
jgi:uncharacterized protein YdcH (DUF465 family)